MKKFVLLLSVVLFAGCSSSLTVSEVPEIDVVIMSASDGVTEAAVNGTTCIFFRSGDAGGVDCNF